MTEKRRIVKASSLPVLSVLFLLLAGCTGLQMPSALPNLSGISTTPTVLYIPGWQSQQGPEYEEMVQERQAEEIRLLNEAYPGANIVYTFWDNAVSWPKCVKNADKLIRDLGKTIRNLKPEQRANLILVGHSLGGKVVIHILSDLDKKGLKVKQGVFLAAALPDDAPEIGRAINASLDPVINIYCPTDGTLRIILGLIGNAPPLGAYGNAIAYPPERFYQYHVAPHFTGNWDWIHNHWSVHYLEILDRILSAKVMPPNEIHPPEKKIVLPHATTPVYQTDANLSTWKTLRTYKGWRLQNSRVIRFHYRILDRRDRVRAEAWKWTSIKESMDSLEAQLGQGE
ncbi:MAG: hypothetical protein E7038_02750 [Lentisphaerae bacterium]|nr:hypothetical protein [Lentisphaerota bacterium]